MTGIPLLAQSDGRFWLPDAASYQAEQVDAVFSFIFWISVFFFTLIVCLPVTLFLSDTRESVDEIQYENRYRALPRRSYVVRKAHDARTGGDHSR